MRKLLPKLGQIAKFSEVGNAFSLEWSQITMLCEYMDFFHLEQHTKHIVQKYIFAFLSFYFYLPFTV